MAAAALSIGTFGATPVLANPMMSIAAAVQIPGKPGLTHDNYEGKGEFNLQATLWSQATANKATLYQDGVAIAEVPLTPSQYGSQTADFKVAPLYNGEYSYYVEYSNEAGASKSNVVVVKVTKGKLPAPPDRTEPNTNGKRIVMYYPEWGIYAGHNQWMPKDIPWEYITHMNYAFATIQGISPTIGPAVGQNEVKLFDEFAATEADAGTGEPYGSEYKGTLGAMRKAKREYSHVRMMMSIGGWSQSANFVEAAATPEARKAFCDSAIALMRKYEFDGIDIDWEYPTFVRDGDTKDNPNDQGNPRANPADKENFTLLMRDLRQALDKAGAEDGAKYELSAAVGCGIDKMEQTEVAKYAPYMDFINLMTYDMHGAWEDITGHQSPMYGRTAAEGNPYDEVVSQYTVVQSVNNFIAAGAPADKLVVGIPYYTRGWGGVEPKEIIPGLPGLHGKATKNATGSYAPSTKGIFDGGVYAGNNPYYYVEEVLEKDPSFKKYWDPIAQVPYLYSASKKEFYTYDDPKSTGIKLDYINANDLGGAILWEATCERVGNPVLTKQIYNAFAGPVKPLPKPGTLAVDKTAVKLGEGYTVTANIPANSDATSFEVLENNAVIKSGQVSAGAQTITVPVVKEKVGTYNYVLVLKNAAGIKNSNTVYVKVEAQAVKPATLSATAPEKGSYTVTLDIPTASNAKNYTLFENGAKIASASMDPMAAAKIDVPCQNKAAGTYTYVAELSNETSKASSNTIKVAVEIGAVNTAPVIKGVKDATIQVGDAYDPMTGVTATDKEDGDLTKAIQVKGNVDTTKVGVYTVAYTVADKEGLEATATCTVTVQEQPPVENTAPVIKGVKDATIKVGDSYDPMTGVTATDKEDGDLTNAIQVNSNVNANKAGTYTVSYTVADSQGLKATDSCQVTVEEEEKPDPNNTYDSSKVYNGGDKVMYNGTEYTAKWWTQGETPGQSAVWEQKPEVGEGGVPVYMPGKAYTGGETVMYNGTVYKAKWWTQATPGTNDEWEVQ